VMMALLKWIRVRPRWKLRYYEVSILTC